MVEETAIRVQINAAKLAGQGIFGILQAVASMLQARQYGQQSIQSLNRQSQALASVELNDKTLPYVRRQLKEYSVDFRFLYKGIIIKHNKNRANLHENVAVSL